MAFADYEAYKTALKNAQDASFVLNTQNVANLTFQTIFSTMLPSVSSPTASVALDKTNARAINNLVPNGGTGRLSVLGANIGAPLNFPFALIIVDVLNISGGLDGTVTTPQTTNLPTAALTRYTSGDGVHAAFVNFAGTGSTATTLTCSYTNQSGTSGRVSPAIPFAGSTNANPIGQMYRIPLQDSDSGVRSVESVTVAGSTGSVGNFGVMLYKPLAMLISNSNEFLVNFDCVSTGSMVGQFNEVLDDACLSVIYRGNIASNQPFTGSIYLGEA